MDDLTAGDSVSICGVCLTVEKTDPAASSFQVFAMSETLKCTTAGCWRKGAAVNLERALRFSDRLGGHLVQGHVDGIGRILSVRRRGASRDLAVEIPAGLRRYIAGKGSIAIDGISLTVGRVSPQGCEVHLIPETLKRTTLDRLRGGERVNIEVDLLARYIHRLLEGEAEPASRIADILQGRRQG
jgi:riboflavin synthase